MPTPSLLMIPSAFKSGVLASVLPSDGAGDFTVSRPSTASRVNSDGIIETMAADVPRLDYTEGGCPVLLTEPQSTNLVKYSEDFTQWVKARSTILSNQAISPDGTLNAAKLSPTVSSGSHFIRYGLSITGDNTQSAYVKAAGHNFIQLHSAQTATDYCNFDILNGVVGTFGSAVESANIEDLGNGWFRCSAHITTGSNGLLIGLVASNSAGYGAGYDALNTTDGVYIFGAVNEPLSYVTSYIKTEGTTATRLADVVTVAPPAGVTEIIETIDGVEQAPITTIPATYTIPVGNINSIEMN